MYQNNVSPAHKNLDKEAIPLFDDSFLVDQVLVMTETTNLGLGYKKTKTNEIRLSIIHRLSFRASDKKQYRRLIYRRKKTG